jgi:hypothetical protein
MEAITYTTEKDGTYVYRVELDVAVPLANALKERGFLVSLRTPRKTDNKLCTVTAKKDPLHDQREGTA